MPGSFGWTRACVTMGPGREVRDALDPDGLDAFVDHPYHDAGTRRARWMTTILT